MGGGHAGRAEIVRGSRNITGRKGQHQRTTEVREATGNQTNNRWDESNLIKHVTSIYKYQKDMGKLTQRISKEKLERMTNNMFGMWIHKQY